MRGLASAIDDIIGSYEEHGNINHLDGTNLPSRSEIAQLLDDLISIVFPGYFVRDHVDDLTTRYFEFFNHYLKGEPAPDWMTQGVPFLEKGSR